MGRLASILLAVSGTVALQVIAQTLLLVSMRFLDRRLRSAGELRRIGGMSFGHKDTSRKNIVCVHQTGTTSTSVLTRIGDHPARHIADLLPWNWKSAEITRAA